MDYNLPLFRSSSIPQDQPRQPVRCQDNDTLCEPCGKQKRHTLAEIFCVDCKEHLCKRCADSHSSMRLGRKHRIFNKTQVKDKVLDIISSLDKGVSDLISRINININDSEKCYWACHNEIEQYTEGVIDQIRRFRNTLIQDLERQFIRDKNDLTEVRNSCEQMKESVSNVKQELSQTDYLNMYTRRLTEALSCKKNLGTLQMKSQAYLYNFRKGSIYLDCLSTKNNLGTIFSHCEDRHEPAPIAASNLEPLSHEDVQHTNEVKKCWITGMAFKAPETLLLVDCQNESVKSYDCTTKKVIFYLRLDSSPWGITVIDPAIAAITLPQQQQIQLISTNPDLVKLRVIPVKDYCYGIAYCDAKLFISCEDSKPGTGTHGKVVIYDHFGNQINTYAHSFGNPKYIRVAWERNQHVIYIRDTFDKQITRIQQNGFIRQYGKFKNCDTVSDIAVTKDGELFLCNATSNNILICGQPSHRSPSFTELLTVHDGLRNPQTVCYIENLNLLYVSCKDNCLLHVYKVQSQT